MGNTRSLQYEIEAAKVLRAQMADIAADDPDFMRDMIEGETNIREIIARLIHEEKCDKAMIEGIDRYSSELQSRKDRLKNRIEMRRALIASGLEIAGLKKLETPVGTASLSPVAPKVITTDESDIPSSFWKAGKPTLDRKMLLDALKSGEQIPGATLSNGSTTVRITGG